MKENFLIAKINNKVGRNQINFIGFPPDIATTERHVEMNAADFLVVEPNDGGVFLIRYSNGEYAGDTWHENTNEAKNQAEYEYSVLPSDWIQVPEDIISNQIPSERISRIVEFYRFR